METLEVDVPFQEIITNSLQSELSVLEKVYLGINLRIEFTTNQWTDSMWKSAKIVLNRMDQVLAELGFAEDHEDRRLIQEMNSSNQKKEEKWRNIQKNVG